MGSAYVRRHNVRPRGPSACTRYGPPRLGCMLPQIDNEALFRHHITQGYNLFAGAGFSVLAQGSRGALPVGNQFANVIRNEFKLDQANRLGLPQVFAMAQRVHPEELRSLVVDTYTVRSFDARYQFLTEWAPKSILTTNVDDLFHVAFQSDVQHFLNDVYSSGSPRAQRTAIDLVQVHGSVRDPNRTMIFGPFDLAAAATSDPDRWHYIRQKITARPTLFWGYGFADSGTLQAMRSSTGARPVVGEAWVQIRPGDDQESLTEYYRALDYNVIVADTPDLLEYFSNLDTPRPAHEVIDLTLSNIPTIAEVPTRPIEDFFAGAAPSWSDVLGDRLHRTKHYTEVANRIAAGRNTVLAGIPGCGKTTLLMQLATHVHASAPKAFHENLGYAEAQMLSNRIGDGRLLLFLDNVASDVRVVEILKNPRVTIVAADRDFPISSVGNRLSDLEFDIVGVTSQNRQDLVSIWKTIPERIRRRRMTVPDVTWGLEPSLYEFVKANVKRSFLSERLLDHIREIHRIDWIQAELLILACYLMYARSALSTDLALAFFRDEGISYEELAERIVDVGELLHEDESLGTDQDYFTARSALMAEEVLEGCPASVLKSVLSRFYSNVSSTRVPAFDVFRRRGYDARIIAHAFRSVNEGAGLYEDIMDRDPSPYVLQQKALFLSQHGRDQEAFAAIEDARSSWRGRKNWTIENTYWKVLFHLNRGKVEAHSEALDLCRRALLGLLQCFEGDFRKGQHALIFSDCALQFSELGSVPADEAVGFLEKSLNILESVRRSEPYLDRPTFLIGQVRMRLRQLS